MSADASSLLHVHRLTTRVGGRTCEGFVFDHHRQAFSLWARAAREAGPLALVTLDRHMDLEEPAIPVPDCAAPLPEIDACARQLCARNDDHVLAAFDSGALSDAAVIARSHQPADLARLNPYRDRAGREHQLAFARTVDEVGPDLLALVERAERVALDVDLDCFSTLSDGHPDEVVPWDEDHVDAFLRPPDSERFWSAVLSRTRLLTIAREPYHCGGLERGARLWRDFSEVFFRRLLGVPPP